MAACDATCLLRRAPQSSPLQPAMIVVTDSASHPHAMTWSSATVPALQLPVRRQPRGST